MSLDAHQRTALLTTKLTAIVREQGAVGGWGLHGVAAAIGIDAGLIEDRVGWVLLDDCPERSLGRALAWADKHELDQLHIFAERHTGALARQAQLFDVGDGTPDVWRVEGRAVSPAAIEPLGHGPDPSAAALELAVVLVDAGAEAVVEHGIVTGEVAGLEVARVIDDEHGTRVEVGVGRHDREAFAMLHGDLPEPEALAKVIATVREQRRPGQPPHPLNRLAAERWMRHALLAEPGVIGLSHLEPVVGPMARTSLHDVMPAFALGIDPDGDSPVLVACSVGVDLELVPTAVDLWAAIAPEAEVRLVLPERDALGITHRLAARAVAPVAVVALDHDWRA